MTDLSGASWTTRQLTHFDASTTPNEAAIVSPDAHGRFAVFSADTNGSTFPDAFFLNADDPGPPAVADTSPRPADLPFEVDLTECSLATDTVHVHARIRQFRGPSASPARSLIVTLSATSNLAETEHSAPVVVQIGNDQVADLTEDLGPFQGSALSVSCDALAVDGSKNQADVVEAHLP